MSHQVLIVEDDESINQVLCDLLRGDGYEAECVINLAEARAQIAQSMPACIVLDLNLPDGTGEELLTELEAAGDVPPTILLSAAVDAPRVAARFGILLVRKPFDIEVLEEAVAKAIENSLPPAAP